MSAMSSPTQSWRWRRTPSPRATAPRSDSARRAGAARVARANGLAKIMNRAGRGYGFGVIRARVLYGPGPGRSDRVRPVRALRHPLRGWHVGVSGAGYDRPRAQEAIEDTLSQLRCIPHAALTRTLY